MNQAFKIINTVGLMRKNGDRPHFTGSLCEKGKMLGKMGTGPISCRKKLGIKKWGLAPFYVGNIYV